MIGTILSIAGGLSAIAFRPTVRTVQVRPEFTPESFLKKCVSCGKEIPIATETCSYCGKPQKGTS